MPHDEQSKQHLKKVDWPEMGAAYQQVRRQMPDAVEGLKQVRPMNWLERKLWPQANAVTHPNSTVAYNRELAQSSGLNPADLLSHELAHVRQNMSRGGTLSNIWNQINPFQRTPGYMDRPDEQDAFGTEQRMYEARRRGDVQLPNLSGRVDPRIAGLRATLK